MDALTKLEVEMLEQRKDRERLLRILIREAEYSIQHNIPFAYPQQTNFNTLMQAEAKISILREMHAMMTELAGQNA